MLSIALHFETLLGIKITSQNCLKCQPALMAFTPSRGLIIVEGGRGFASLTLKGEAISFQSVETDVNSCSFLCGFSSAIGPHSKGFCKIASYFI